MGLVPWRCNLRRRVAADWCRPKSSPVGYSVLVADDAANDAIVRVADHYDAKLIALGAPSTGFTQRIVGSTSDRVVRQSHRPVMVIPSVGP